MRHPIYSDNRVALLIEKYEEHGYDVLDNLKQEGIPFQPFLIAIDVHRSGVFIDTQKDSFMSEFSKKTIKKLKINDINLPFEAFSIKIKDDTFNCSICGEYLYFFKNKDLGRTSGLPCDIILENLIEEAIENKVDNEIIDTVIEIMSILMYISMFKKNKSRVVETTIQAKAQKKKRIASHTINKINLFQPKPKGFNLNGCSSKTFTKKWIVRGHWRNQFYKLTNEIKQIWIDPFWKGVENKETVKKIYVV